MCTRSRWRRPTRLPGRSESGRVNPAAVAGVAFVLTIGIVGVAFSFGGVGGSDRATTDLGRAPGATTVACTPTAERPGPAVDLGVQAATGDPESPLLPVAKVRRLVALADRAGATVISTAAQWHVIQPEADGPYHFGSLDRVLDAAQRQGLQARIQLGGTPAWALDSPASGDWNPPLTDPELARWSRFVTATMEHVRGRVAYVEAWGEPDNRDYWATGPDPAAFARLLGTTYDAVKAVDPTATVISGSLAGNDIGYLEKVYAAVDDLGRAQRPFDAVGVHPFTGALDPGELAPGRRYEREPFGAYDENFVGFRELHVVMAAHGDAALPLYIGEFGYTTKKTPDFDPVTDAQRADYLERAFDAATCSPYVTVMSWYYLHPNPWSPESWTLLSSSLRPNQTYDALRAWTTARREAVGAG